MIKFELLVCAESLIKGDNDTYSAINIFEDYVAEAFPTFIPRMEILLAVSRVSGDPNSIVTNFLIANNEMTLYSSTPQIQFYDKPKGYLKLSIGSLAIGQPGFLLFKFTYEQEVIQYKINLKLRDRPSIISESGDKKL
jgi:hypothetical protein